MRECVRTCMHVYTREFMLKQGVNLITRQLHVPECERSITPTIL